MIVLLHFLALTVVSINGFLFSRQVCYDHLGCFSNASPYNNAKGFLPESPDHIQTRFLLYTRQNPTNAQILSPYDRTTVSGSHFNGHKKTVFITHGYQDDGHAPWIRKMTAAFLTKDDLNVIAVDWSKGADNINYIQAAANTRVVGATIAILIKELHRVAHLPFNMVHLVGHSLGSHISGYAGAGAPGVGRITGLDPAGPLFENSVEEVRLDPSDALFVEAIHTDADSLLELGFGLQKAIADADFYPNGGEKQPGCDHELGKHLFSLITGRIEGFTSSVACSHMRVLDFFTESITSPCGFTAYPCANKKDFEAGRCRSCGHGCSKMGFSADPHLHGTFYLSTNSASPFCEN
ncbi:inactive pancreatic lipase-related protein 1-like [Crassostrea virginica]|uniref:Inactive pancreatic lipase-related protein 1-like n=1 Tax=Crassostrea virginica TaxID=6565 RepID=A0A8B8EKX7_CRAVI|nr:inactive pancreatic lipase-related protein 1-like [Crassostrea virginica]